LYAASHHSLCTCNLGYFSLHRLFEYRQQDDSPLSRYVVGDPIPLASKIEPEFAQLAAQLTCIWFTERHSFALEEIDIELCLTELFVT